MPHNYLTPWQVERRKTRVLKYISSLYRREFVDIVNYIDLKKDLILSSASRQEDIVEYCCRLSLKEFKELQAASRRYWASMDAQVVNKGEFVAYTLPDGFYPVYSVSISRKLDSPDAIGYHIVKTDKEDYIPVDPERIAAGLMEAANDVLLQAAAVESEAQGH